MGAESSTPRGSTASEAGSAVAKAAPGGSLWEGVPRDILWLVQAQVRLLLANHPSALLYRPETLSDDPQDDRVQRAELQPHEARLAAAALQFCLAHPATACVIPGGKSAGEVRANVALVNERVPAALWAELKADGLLPDAAPTPEE